MSPPISPRDSTPQTIYANVDPVDSSSDKESVASDEDEDTLPYENIDDYLHKGRGKVDTTSDAPDSTHYYGNVGSLEEDNSYVYMKTGLGHTDSDPVAYVSSKDHGRLQSEPLRTSRKYANLLPEQQLRTQHRTKSEGGKEERQSSEEAPLYANCTTEEAEELYSEVT